MSQTPSLRKITPGQVVLSVFSLSEAAEACGGINPSTVWRWGQKAPKGTGGVVPSGYHVALLQLAHRLGRRLSTDDLVLGRHKAES